MLSNLDDTTWGGGQGRVAQQGQSLTPVESLRRLWENGMVGRAELRWVPGEASSLLPVSGHVGKLVHWSMPEQTFLVSEEIGEVVTPHFTFVLLLSRFQRDNPVWLGH